MLPTATPAIGSEIVSVKKKKENKKYFVPELKVVGLTEEITPS